MRVYLPVALDVLARWHGSGSSAASVEGFAAVATGSDAAMSSTNSADAVVDDEAAEYAAFNAAVAECGPTAPRLVVSADCDDDRVVSLEEESGRIRVDTPIAWASIAAVHADDPEAAQPDPLGHLLWFATSEVGDLLARFGVDPTIE